MSKCAMAQRILAKGLNHLQRKTMEMNLKWNIIEEE